MKNNTQSIQKTISKFVKKNPRAMALYILNEFHRCDILLDNLMRHEFDQISAYDQRDRALIHSLVYGVIRWRSNLDNIIQQISHISISKISLPILNTVRMGVFQMNFMDRIPEHAAVNSSVELVHIFAPNYLARFVNGILREAARSKETIKWPDQSTQITQFLSLKYAYPKWMVQRWIEYWGIKIAKDLCDSENIVPPIIIRTNTLKIERSPLIKKLSSSAQIIEKTLHAPDGIRLSNLQLAIGNSELFQKGFYQVQDEASQLIGLLVSPQPGETILDACAGRGGKTGHLAQCMNNRGTILAVDRSNDKLGILTDEMKRLGVSIVSCCQHRWKKDLKGRLFDRVLLDAPCSGLGVIRRHPDMKWKKSKEHILQNAIIQKELLKIISMHVKPKGKLIYCVCSLEPEETYQVVKNFLSQNKNFVIDKESKSILSSFIDKDGLYYFRPDLHLMDGFFAVCLIRL
jgi:16S rRNA (cytosine967-C5)-methyltransferase